MKSKNTMWPRRSILRRKENGRLYRWSLPEVFSVSVKNVEALSRQGLNRDEALSVVPLWSRVCLKTQGHHWRKLFTRSSQNSGWNNCTWRAAQTPVQSLSLLLSPIKLVRHTFVLTPSCWLVTVFLQCPSCISITPCCMCETFALCLKWKCGAHTVVCSLQTNIHFKFNLL